MVVEAGGGGVLQRAARALTHVVALLTGRRRPDCLQGRVALVTGAGSSLGRELSVCLALCGCRLVCIDDDVDAARATAKAVNAKVGADAAEAVACDCGDRRQVSLASRALLARHGAVDVLVLAAPPPSGARVEDHVAKQFWVLLCTLVVAGLLPLNTPKQKQKIKARINKFKPKIPQEVCLGVVAGMAARGGGRVLAVCREDCPGDPPSLHTVATTSLVEALTEQLRGTGVSLTCAYQYRFSNSTLPLTIPELSDEQAASEMVSAVRRRQSRVVLPRRPLFWNGVLRSLHLVADWRPHDGLCLDAPAPAPVPVAAAAPATNTAKS